jgi:hypothetical protein
VPTRPSAPINRNYPKPLPRNKNNRQPRWSYKIHY